MNEKQRRHMNGSCGIWTAHSDEDHRAFDLIRGVKRGRIQEPSTGRWYKDGYAPFQLTSGEGWVGEPEPDVEPDLKAVCGTCSGRYGEHYGYDCDYPAKGRKWSPK